MYTTCTREEAKQKVAALIEENAGMSIPDMAENIGLKEAEVTLVMPSEMVTAVEGKHAEAILTQLPEWGKVTTIIVSFGSIFEIKGTFPKGKTNHGYYNLLSREGLNGHLRLDLITDIAFVSKPFHGMETHQITFFNAQGECVFKVYLGRDKARNLIPEQVEKFHAMKKEFA
ncbi:heme utilization cystosolic carrier protein HutX [Thaumasiovibrio subtropicus]|uniref:heme utilization cystosolic carrier protein HutX n=1 Tax=Thaumasiovibrio subtropicus TaxID=1891207 RepID=UPI000B354A6E|nr:heme utilization cystosolic carrier protein HutX [Thaumasiovibrio subtropicus]